MDGYCDSAFRSICHEVAPDIIVFSEFYSADGLHHNPLLAKRVLTHNPIEHPLVFQIFGNTPEVFLSAGKIIESYGAQWVDINMGCPAKSRQMWLRFRSHDRPWQSHENRQYPRRKSLHSGDSQDTSRMEQRRWSRRIREISRASRSKAHHCAWTNLSTRIHRICKLGTNPRVTKKKNVEFLYSEMVIARIMTTVEQNVKSRGFYDCKRKPRKSLVFYQEIIFPHGKRGYELWKTYDVYGWFKRGKSRLYRD